MWKFRSMIVGADALVDEHADQNVNDGLLFKIKDDPRITPVGAVLRRLSLDELPQLFNVLRGEMSFVGPRPLPVEPDAFDDLAAKRHSVRPGITGPWQVHGGHALSYDDMVALDLSYINGWRFRHDMWLFLTLPLHSSCAAPTSSDASTQPKRRPSAASPISGFLAPFSAFFVAMRNAQRTNGASRHAGEGR